MNKMFLLFLSLALPVASFAQCIGSGSVRTCYDEQGNSYVVTRAGNQTFVTGQNSRTGSSWSQTSSTYGNITFQNGRSSNGGSWNQTIQKVGNGVSYSGTDSNGNSFNKFCTSFGCN